MCVHGAYRPCLQIRSDLLIAGVYAPGAITTTSAVDVIARVTNAGPLAIG